jgi:hypothetical protein
MTEQHELPVERDPEIAALLRAHLVVHDDDAFIASVLARLHAAQRESSWDILARWAPLGVAATVILALGLGALLGWEIRQEADAPAAPVAPSATLAQWVTSRGPVTNDIVLAAVMEGDRWLASPAAVEGSR